MFFLILLTKKYSNKEKHYSYYTYFYSGRYKNLNDSLGSGYIDYKQVYEVDCWKFKGLVYDGNYVIQEKNEG